MVHSMGGRSRRKLSFPPIPEDRDEQSVTCALCHGQHSQLSEPQSWKNEQARTVIRSLEMAPDCRICRPCRNDITRLTKNPDHQPRWAKQQQSVCCLPGCTEPTFSHSKMATQEQLGLIAHTLGCSSLPTLPIPTPLCKHHYHLIYNTLQPTQTQCPTCGTWLKITTARFCPDPHCIQKYLHENTGFEGRIQDGAKVCLECYKSHLQILREQIVISTDKDLSEVLESLKMKIAPIHEIKCTNDVIQRAMTLTAVHAGECLLSREALLLPSLFNVFSAHADETIAATNLERGGDTKGLVTPRWILSYLTAIFQHHLSYTCKVKKYGTLLYRSNGDVLYSLSVALHKLSRATQQKGSSCERNSNLTPDPQCLIHVSTNRYGNS